MKNLFDTTYFRCSVVEDAATVEACGALKNVVAVGAGIGDGHKMGDNTKAAIVRLGMLEIIEFIDFFFKESNLRTYFESCGLADLVTTCHGGRNRKLGEALVYSNKTLIELEEEILKGQSFQGPLVAKAVFEILKSKKMVEKFPIFVAVHLICQRKMKTSEFINSLMNHPEHKTH
uniref:glycerol-3-phosphate dehydrogenase (NAD(+)) n=2 Tax=Octopus bimaculoides TaxID=37653 RepID=A0A0L8FYV0_OCTBM